MGYRLREFQNWLGHSCVAEFPVIHSNFGNGGQKLCKNREQNETAPL